LTWRDAASVRIKLKVPAIQRYHHELAVRVRWLAILQVHFLYGPPNYIFFTESDKVQVNTGDISLKHPFTV